MIMKEILLICIFKFFLFQMNYFLYLVKIKERFFDLFEYYFSILNFLFIILLLFFKIISFLQIFI